MTRKLTILGLAILAIPAALVLSGVTASADVEEEFTASEYPATLHGAQTTAHVFALSGGPEIKCEAATFTGTLAKKSSELTVTPSYSKCTTVIAGKVAGSTLTFPNCDYRYTKTGSEYHLECQPPQEPFFTIHVYKNAAHTENECTFKVNGTTAQQLSFENVGGEKGVVVVANLTGITYTRTEGTLGNCGPAHSTLTYTGTSTLTAKNEKGSPIGFDLG